MVKDEGSDENESVGDDEDDCSAASIVWRIVVIDADTRLASSSSVRRRPKPR